eukprot:CAMPEP_0201589924 /NCGR_PEP_ID=MMETSP0190_2-20130828/172184_1 /ASSEMBLY_ACC=CAM_ASM_000263 /TAXON_ID=37353 /ORGANISM="Rosalina sp." /LENGTH=962 /DNA_ID=CAMNT_0048045033 /DNA_START=27 /DNA_END=2915 /DNA_ORIENTATION=+
MLTSVALCLVGVLSIIQASPKSECIEGPNSPSDYDSWMSQITAQKKKDLDSISYNGSIFEVPAIQWTQSSFIQPQMHGYDAYFYDINTHSYTYDKWNQDLITRYGGIDAFLFWVTYTNIGADDRNQFEMNLAIPGQMKALQAMVEYFHSLTPPIHVLFPYNPWDTGTHDSGNPDYITMAQFLNDTGGDGFNGDTMGSIPEDFYTYSRDKYGHPIALEPEGGGSLQSMNWDTMGWGYWTPYAYKPYVGKWKWYDARRMTNVCDRWAQNRSDDIQNAYFNGLGYESWENVWGCWNGITPRDGEAIRRAGTIMRYFGNRANNPMAQNFTQDLGWLPFVPVIDSTNAGAVFASQFTVQNGTDNQQVLFLMVNRVNKDISNMAITFKNTFTVSTINAYDCYYGKALTPTMKNGDISVNVDIEGLGYGAVLVTFDSRSKNTDLDKFLTEMNTMTQKPLSSYDWTWKYLLQEMKRIEATELYDKAPTENMSTIPWGIFYFNNTGVEIEGNDYEGVDIQYPFEMHPQREHKQYMTIDKFYMDTYPVTCSQYSKYLESSKYSPTDSYNYLKNWKYDDTTKTYTYPDGYANKPVTYVSLNEARLYCASVGKRLPHSYEWQYAAQGNLSMYSYPWGNSQGMGTKFPQQQHGRTIPGPEDVDKYASVGSSMFGVADLIGNVWQYTDEFTDNHTRSVVVRGSANYRPDGSMWYFPNAWELQQHNKYFLMDDSYERAGTIGFRCAADAIQPSDEKPAFWDGSGTYCKNKSDTTSGPFCGRLSEGRGYENLTEVGGLDWIQFGINSKDNSAFKMIRKESSTPYIGNISATTSVMTYFNNPKGFFWSDGAKDMNMLPKDDASTSGVYVDSGTLNFEVNRLKAGSIYKLRVFAGVYQNRGSMNAELKIGSGANQKTYSFMDSTVYAAQDTSDIEYEFIIDLSDVTSSEMIQVLIKWIVDKGNGNITLQAIALELLEMNK